MAILEGGHIVPPPHSSYIQKPLTIRVNRYILLLILMILFLFAIHFPITLFEILTLTIIPPFVKVKLILRELKDIFEEILLEYTKNFPHVCILFKNIRKLSVTGNNNLTFLLWKFQIVQCEN